MIFAIAPPPGETFFGIWGSTAFSSSTIASRTHGKLGNVTVTAVVVRTPWRRERERRV